MPSERRSTHQESFGDRNLSKHGWRWRGRLRRCRHPRHRIDPCLRTHRPTVQVTNRSLRASCRAYRCTSVAASAQPRHRLGTNSDLRKTSSLALRVSHESRLFSSFFFLSALFLLFLFAIQRKFLFKFQNWNFTSCRSLIFLPAGNFFSPARISFKISPFFSPLYFPLSNFPRSQENLGGHRLSCVYKVQSPGSRRKFSSSNRSCFHDLAHCYCSVSKMDSNLFIPRIFDPIISRSNQNNFPFRFQNSSSGLFPLRNFYFGLCWQFLFYF